MKDRQSLAHWGIALLMLIAGVMNIMAQTDSTKTVRVGWYESPFSQTDESGKRSGYAYEYQLKISAVTGWRYEYVEGTWPQLLELLKRGELDLLSDVSPIFERKPYMLFSESSMSYEAYELIVRRDAGVTPGSLGLMNGKRVGIEKGSAQTGLSKEWMKRNGVRFELVEQDASIVQMQKMLAVGQIDGLVAPANNADLKTFVPVCRIGGSPVHFGINKARPDLKQELDLAMEQIQMTNPAYKSYLSGKYHMNELVNHTLSEKELRWLQKHGKIRVAYRDNYLPFCRKNPETGATEGFLQDFIDHNNNAFEGVQMEIEAIAYPTMTDALEAVKRGEADAAFPYGAELFEAEVQGLVMADAVYNSVEMAVVRQSDRFRPEDSLRAAINSHNPNYLSHIESHYPHWKVVDYRTTPECISGIARGEADLLLLSSYRLGVMAQNVKENRLKAVPTGLTLRYGFVSRKGEDEVHNILCRLSGMTDDSFVQSSLVSHSDTYMPVSTRQFIEDNVFLFFGCILAVTLAIVLLLRRSRIEHRKAEEANEDLKKVTVEQQSQIEEIQLLNTELDRQNGAIRATSTRYFCIYAIDVVNDHFHEVTSLPHMSKVLGREGVASSALEKAWQLLVVDEDKPLMQAFHDVSKWDSYLSESDLYSCEYRGMSTGWCRATIFAAKHDESGRVTDVVYTLESINKRKQAELALQDANESLTQLSEEQQSQIEEIQTLNNDLEEHQSQLEEMTAEQEAQIEEIQALNRELEKAHEEAVDAAREINREKRRQEHFHDIISQSGNGVWTIVVKDGQAPTMVCDDKMKRLLGIDESANLTPEEVYDFWYSHITPGAIASVNASVAKMMEGKMDENTYLWTHPEKGDIFVRCGGRAEKQEDGSFHLSGYHADVTDIVTKEAKYAEKLRQARDEAEAANHAKTSFLFNMSHDIRTPMNAIIGFTSLLRRNQNDPVKRNDYLDKIERSSSVLLSIINNVLEMARIEKGTIEIEETAWSADQFYDTLYSIFHEMMRQKGLEFTRKVEVEHQYVLCDPTKLREVYINLLSNAYKYTNRGGKVSIHLRELPSEREGYVLYQTTISDTGMGMSEEFLPHLFDEFSREHSTTDNKIEGTGLGMSIVKRLVELMGGTIEVTSKLKVGTTFVVTIPHKIAERSDLSEHTGTKLDPKIFAGKRILLAEDNELNAEIAMEILGEYGFEFGRAEDGKQCVEMLEHAPAGYYDVILMDIQMPNMNGYEATRVIRQMADYQKAAIPILAMTANAFEEDKNEAIRVGMNGHLSKPIDVTELMKALAGILK